MKMIQCRSGHFYDSEKHSSCPYCTPNNQNVGATVGFFEHGSASIGETMGMNENYDYEIGKTVALTDEEDREEDIGKTVALFQKEHNIKRDPVVGWLVCISGDDKGKDYRIHSDNNYIGRDKKMDIQVEGDDTISRENHAIISYDTKYKKFYFLPGEGRAIVRVNDISIFQATEVKDYDTIEIGNSKFKFISFCGGDFSWD